MSKRVLAALRGGAALEQTPVPAAPLPPTCGNCVHWHRDAAASHKAGLRAPCRRFPPVGTFGGVPVVTHDYSCGEHRHG